MATNTRTPPLTRELSPASPVGTDIAPTKVVDNSLAGFLGDVTSITDRTIGRQAEAATTGTVSSFLQQENLDSFEGHVDAKLTESDVAVTGEINQELGKVERQKLGVQQGRGGITFDRYVTELDSRVRKLKARFPGHTDVIDARVQKLTRINPGLKARELLFEEASETSKFEGQILAQAARLGSWVNQVPGDPTSPYDIPATVAKTQRRLLQLSAIGNGASRVGSANSTGDFKTSDEAMASLRTMVRSGGNAIERIVNQFNMFRSQGMESEFTNDIIINAAAVSLAQEQEELAELIQGKGLTFSQAEELRNELEAQYDGLRTRIGDFEGKGGAMVTAELLQRAQANNTLNSLTNLQFVTSVANALNLSGGSQFMETMVDPEVMAAINKVGSGELGAFATSAEFDKSVLEAPDTVAAMNKYRNTIVRLLVNPKESLAAMVDDMPEASADMYIDQTWKAMEGLSSTVIPSDEPEGIQMWGDTVAQMREVYNDYLQGDRGNKKRLIETMMQPSYALNYEELKKIDPDTASIVGDFAQTMLGDDLLVLRGEILDIYERGKGSEFGRFLFEDIFAAEKANIVYDKASKRFVYNERLATYRAKDEEIQAKVNDMNFIIQHMQDLEVDMDIDTVVGAAFPEMDLLTEPAIKKERARAASVDAVTQSKFRGSFTRGLAQAPGSFVEGTAQIFDTSGSGDVDLGASISRGIENIKAEVAPSMKGLQQVLDKRPDLFEGKKAQEFEAAFYKGLGEAKDNFIKGIKAISKEERSDASLGPLIEPDNPEDEFLFNGEEDGQAFSQFREASTGIEYKVFDDGS